MSSPSFRKQRGVALLIVLAFIVLLAGMTVAYLSRSSTDRQVAHAGFNDAKAEELARSAFEVIVGDLKQEIADGSNASTVDGVTIYLPASTLNITPMRSGNPIGNPDPVPNLTRRSVYPDNIMPPGVGSRASNLSSAPSEPASPKKGEITLARWNKHYLIPKADASTDDSNPVTSFVAPDWIFVASSGPSIVSRPSTTILGRYAYAIYDEGGLLDINVAGYPTDASLPGTAVATDAPVGRKGCLALADLVPLIPADTVPHQRAAINKIIGWRNYVTGQPGGTFPDFTFTSAHGGTWYNNFVMNNTSGFLKVSPMTMSGRTDQAFIQRQQLLAFRNALGISISCLEYLGTFSRDLNMPTWESAATLRATSPFARRDGTTAQVGEPLVRRFPISELAWLGPVGIAPPGTAETVKRDFGLVWIADHWDYYGATGSTLARDIAPITGDREPEFFQLLAFANPAATIQRILTTGACLIDQYDADGITTRIDFAGAAMPPSDTNSIAWGMETAIPPVPASAPTPNPAPTPIVLNRPFQNVGEFGYAYRDVSQPPPAPTPRTVDFFSSTSSECAILDLFSVSTAFEREGAVNLNTRQDLVVRSILSFATANEPATAISSTKRNSTGPAFVAATAANPAVSRADLARLTTECGLTLTGLTATALEEYKELISRSFVDLCQTRTWNLMIDVIAQSGRYPPNASTLADFVVEGEKRYWLHVAIDRFTGEVIDQQLELVTE